MKNMRNKSTRMAAVVSSQAKSLAAEQGTGWLQTKLSKQVPAHIHCQWQVSASVEWGKTVI